MGGDFLSYSTIIDAFSPTSVLEIRNALLDNLIPVLNNNGTIIFICIGSDRTTGDCLGPLVGYKLSNYHINNIFIYGSLENPIHSANIEDILSKIYFSFSNPYVVAIDSALGSVQNIGKIIIEDNPITPGAALNKTLPPVGNICIKGVVNISSSMEYMILQNTRLYTVMTLADTISQGITKFIESINNNVSRET
mgnify:CR=1 FL=1